LLSNLELDLYDQLDEVVRDADFLSLHVPLTVETRGLLDARRLSLMKPGSYLINVSRGGLIDEKVLCEVLSTGHLAGAALDVFETEPLPQDSPLISLENVILSPHSAMATRECIRRLVTEAVLGIVDFLSGKQPKYVTNPEVLK